MNRIQFIELHEQSWFPPSLRDEVTDALQFGQNLLRTFAPIAPLLENALAATGSRKIVDLCSGGGGPWIELSKMLQCGGQAHIQIVLTDKYPNLGAYQFASASSKNHIGFYRDPVDATKVPSELDGFRTMFSSFHHFQPDEARAVLQNAVNAREGIGIFEITRRTPSTIALMFLWALMPFVFTPWIRPFRWSRLLCTYIFPIIPLVLLFDGVVSCLRTYGPQELREMVAKLPASKYLWDVGVIASGPIPIPYLIGYPPALTSHVVKPK